MRPNFVPGPRSVFQIARPWRSQIKSNGGRGTRFRQRPRGFRPCPVLSTQKTRGNLSESELDPFIPFGLEAHASRDHTLAGPLWEGYRESRRCSRDTYPESYITKYTSIRRKRSRPSPGIRGRLYPVAFFERATRVANFNSFSYKCCWFQPFLVQMLSSPGTRLLGVVNCLTGGGGL